MYAQILVFLPIKSKATPFWDYVIPLKMVHLVAPGVLVVVPVRTSLLPGIVMTLSDAPSVPNPRAIHSILDPDPALSENLLDLARWLARETLSPLHKCVQVMLPLALRPRPYLHISAQVLSVPGGLPAGADAMLSLLIQRGPLKNDQIKRALKGVDLRRARQLLKKRGLIKVDRLLRLPRSRPKAVRLVSLALAKSSWGPALQGLRRLDLYHEVLNFLAAEAEPVETQVIYAETGAQASHLKTLLKRGMVRFEQKVVVRDPLADMIFTPDSPLDLTPGQQAAWDVLLDLLHQRPPLPPVLLFGVTGSGKTELYMRAAAEVLAAGKQVLMLVPEISLTPQTVRRFALRFPGKVGLWHSAMSEGERFDTWRRVRAGNLPVVVGARSALFAPFSDLGLIVLDEEEDASYKQGRVPLYHSRELAAELARRVGALVILGSATPSLDSYARALAGRYRLLELPRRVMAHQRRVADWRRELQLAPQQPASEGETQAYAREMPPVHIVDMRAELKVGNRSIFSATLQTLVDEALARKEQVLLFLNRRGTATYVFCRDCGWVASCPRCDIPLTYHAKSKVLLCHRCGHYEGMRQSCHECGSLRVRAFGLGTQGLESRVLERWPDARILRWDRDTARSHAAHTAIMGRFVQGDADVLVGTQMVARGLDIPKVTVVGVISADTALYMPDFRAAERAFQLLAQVAGRAGRGVLGGQVVFQTYHPEHYAVRRAAAHDFVGFAQQELLFRQRAGYPPAMRMARLVFAHAKQSRARDAAQHLAACLQDALIAANLPSEDLIGPAPAFFARVCGRYRWQILLRSISPADFLRGVEIPAGWLVDIDPVDVL